MDVGSDLLKTNQERKEVGVDQGQEAEVGQGDVQEAELAADLVAEVEVQAEVKARAKAEVNPGQDPAQSLLMEETIAEVNQSQRASLGLDPGHQQMVPTMMMTNLIQK